MIKLIETGLELIPLTLVQCLERLFGLAEPVKDVRERLARLVVSRRELDDPGVRSLRRVQLA